jgi:hypothetical protein
MEPNGCTPPPWELFEETKNVIWSMPVGCISYVQNKTNKPLSFIWEGSPIDSIINATAKQIIFTFSYDTQQYHNTSLFTWDLFPFVICCLFSQIIFSQTFTSVRKILYFKISHAFKKLLCPKGDRATLLAILCSSVHGTNSNHPRSQYLEMWNSLKTNLLLYKKCNSKDL